MSARTIAALQALFVVFLWATSWVFIKIGLQAIPPITFAGLRYSLAFTSLLVFLLFHRSKSQITHLSGWMWVRLIILGLLYYAVTQGAAFVALAYLPAITVNLLWSFSSVAVALLGIFWLSERPTLFQWGGIALAFLGAVTFFYPVAVSATQILGVIVALVGILANAISSIMSRDVNRSGQVHPLIVTVVSMGVGSLALLSAGVSLEGIPHIDLKSWAIIFWLALVNTALAFTLWNHTLRTLTAIESSIINGTMLIWIPILAIIFLGEKNTSQEIIGLVMAGFGTFVVQMRRFPQIRKTTS